MSNNKDKAPEYTPLPLPDPNSDEYASATAKKKPRRMRWFLAVVFLILLLMAIGGATVGHHYWKKTEHFDISTVAFTQTGSVVRDREGESMGRLFSLDRLPVQIGELPGHFIDALVATEDSRFFEHPGFDPVGIARAAISNARAGDIREGGSTITQQLARHSFKLGGRTVDRKLSEIAVAVRIEKAYGKHEILEHYLNQIYFGSGFWGIGSAARGYFGKTVAELDIAESALLCAIIKSPSSYSPFVNPDISLDERNRSLTRMQELGLLDPAIAVAESAKPLALTDRVAETAKRPRFLLTRIQKEARSIAKEHNLLLDGLLIETSVDSQLQSAARAHLEIGLTRVEEDPNYPHPTLHDFHHPDADAEEGDAPATKRSATDAPPYLQGSAIVIHNGTGEILAAIGGRNFTDSEFDRAFGARRPPGTAFLPLVYAAAFEQEGIDIQTELTDAPMDNRQVMIGGTQGVLGEWGRESFVSRYEGQISAGLALLDSRGAASVELGNRIGLKAIHDTARRVGINSPLREYPSTFLGQSELTLAELAQAYTVFPNLGKVTPDIHLVTRIYGPDGALLYEAPAARPQENSVTSELTAARITAILRASLYIGSNRSAYKDLGLDDPSVAGKGGTTHGFTDGWFIGYNDVVTCAVWVGLDSPEEIHPRAFSRNVALPIWVDLMKALPEAPLRHPAGCVNHKICLRTGHTASEDCVENFADGKPHSTAVALPFPAGAQAPPVCKHRGMGQRFVHGLLAHSSAADSQETGEKENADDPKTKPPKVIRSRSPLVIGADPYAGQ